MDGADEVLVRRARGSDLEAAAALRWAWIVDERGAASATSRDEFVAELVRWARKRATTHECFVAVADGEVVGTAWLALVDRVPSPRAVHRRTGDVQSVFVLPDHRGRRIGARLVDAVVDAAAAAGAERLTVHSSPEAVPLYSRAGLRSSELLRDRTLNPVG